ncbi:MAG: ATP-binding protein [Eubacteriales bacterium]|nr:ATP-binding protein [Eubacteriales bacterium]
MDFVGRERELALLNAHCEGEGFFFVVSYGRRRVGKTRLIQEYIKDKPAIYFMGIEANAQANLAGMSLALQRSKKQKGLAAYSSFEALFEALGEISAARRIIFVIDEFPYLAAAAPEISSLLQRFCDHIWQKGQLHLILCGSTMRFKERQVLGVKSPLFGRRSAQIMLNPFTFFESRRMLPKLCLEDAALLHDATGGIPAYQRYIQPDKSTADNLTALFLSPGGRMFEEPSNLLKQELREPRVYNSILGAIAGGASRSNEIATKIGLESAALNHYLAGLEELRIIVRERPVGQKSNRKTIYRITDGSFRFWYRFVLPHMSAVMTGLGSQVFTQFVAPFINNHMGQGFEAIFYDYFDRWQMEGSLPGLAGNRGRWWGNNPALKQEEEIDLVGFGADITYFGEAKWRNEPMKADVIADLERKSQLVPAKHQHYLLLSKSGYTKSAHGYAENRPEIHLMRFE